jgi:hypothetical protein
LLEIYLGGGQVPSGYLFPENGEHVMGELMKTIAQELKKQGVLETDEVVSVEAADLELKRVSGTVAGKYHCGGSPRARGPKARGTGLVPRWCYCHCAHGGERNQPSYEEWNVQIIWT